MFISVKRLFEGFQRLQTNYIGQLECDPTEEIVEISKRELAEKSRDIIHEAVARRINVPELLPMTIDRFLETTSDISVDVAITPYGNADSPLYDKLFVLPAVEKMTVGELIKRLKTQKSGDPIRYMQSQDNNIKDFGEFLSANEPYLLNSSLNHDNLDVTNLWIGGPGTTSRLHNDNYDNFFHQMTGYKIVYLLPPSHTYHAHEKFFTTAQYVYDSGEFKIQVGKSSFHHTDEENLCKAAEQDEERKILFASMDPREFSDANCEIYKVILGPGDILFIPALWYHQIEIPSDDQNMPNDISISMNYWIQPCNSNPLWSNWDFIRYCSLLARGYHDKDYFRLYDED